MGPVGGRGFGGSVKFADLRGLFTPKTRVIFLPTGDVYSGLKLTSFIRLYDPLADEVLEAA